MTGLPLGILIVTVALVLLVTETARPDSPGARVTIGGAVFLLLAGIGLVIGGIYHLTNGHP